MAKIYVFGIGGTGSRVIKSLSMLLSSGADLNGFDFVPIIIDPDKSNGDVTRTIDILNTYKKVRSKLSFESGCENHFFQTKIGLKADSEHEAFRLVLENIENEQFEDYIDYQGLKESDKALMSMLFSKNNLNADMEVGFKGNPNIGSVVLNQFKSSEAYQNFSGTFEQGDRIFIISSIFGGTGAAGFPLLLKNLKDKDENVAAWNLIRQAPVGAVTVLPYFGVKKDEDSEIDKSTFISKAKAALDYYRKNVKSLNTLYYVGDDKQLEYDNVEGSVNQKNKAHFVELASALAIIDFAKQSSELLTTDSEGVPVNPEFKEYGIKEDVASVTFSELGENSQNSVQKGLTQFLLFEKFMSEYLKDNLNAAWAKGKPEITESFLHEPFYNDFLKNYRNHFSDWLNELAANNRSFDPFRLEVGANNLFELVKGVKPRVGLLERGKNYSRMDYMASKVEKDLSSLPIEDKFMSLFYQTTERIVKEKYNF